MPVRACLVDGQPAWRWGRSGTPVLWGGRTGLTSSQAAALVAERGRRVAVRRLSWDVELGLVRGDARRRTAWPQHRERYPDRLTAMHEALLHSRLAMAEKLLLDLAGPALDEMQAELDGRRRDARGTLRVLDVLQAVRKALAETSPEDGVRYVGEEIDDATLASTDRELGRLFNIPLSSVVGSDAVVEAWVKSNVALIKGMEDAALGDMERMVVSAMSAGKPTLALRDDIARRFGVHRNRASFLARDQTAKIAAKITETQHTKYGIVEYTWSTSGDSRVRQEHADLDGTIQKWAEPPIADKRGTRGHPGEVWQCRCTAIAILPDEDKAEILRRSEARKEQELRILQASPTVKGEIPNRSGFSDWNAARIAELRKGARRAVGLPEVPAAPEKPDWEKTANGYVLKGGKYSGAVIERSGSRWILRAGGRDHELSKRATFGEAEAILMGKRRA